jgi:DNA-directed RNA polymerase subunit RPC12/RpoP
MALQIDQRTSAIYCSDCNGRVFSKSGSVAGLIATMAFIDIAIWILAGLLILVGLLWLPAYLIAACLVGFGLYRTSKREPRFACSNCKREFTYEEVHGHSAI